MKNLSILMGLLALLLAAGGCSAGPQQAQEPPPSTAEAMPTSTSVRPTRTLTPAPPTSTPSPEATTSTPPPERAVVQADVISVEASGGPGAYRFSVGIRSPDTGCEQYADWWEVVGEEGELLYRRVLLHSHANEQPFVRSGGPVEVEVDRVVWVRAHMNAGGYGGAAFTGSVQEGFAEAALDAAFAAGLETKPPLPDGCAF